MFSNQWYTRPQAKKCDTANIRPVCEGEIYVGTNSSFLNNINLLSAYITGVPKGCWVPDVSTFPNSTYLDTDKDKDTHWLIGKTM